MKTPHRTYHLTDLMGNAQRWVDAINKAKDDAISNKAKVDAIDKAKAAMPQS